MIVRYYEAGRAVVRDLMGEELHELVKKNTDSKQRLAGDLMVFRGFLGIKNAAAPEASENNGKKLYPWTLSTDIVDRYGDIVEQDWVLTYYKENPVVLWAHNHYMPAIGIMNSITSEAPLSGLIELDIGDEVSAKIAGKVDRGFIKAGSVGFMPGEWKPIEIEVNGKHQITGYRLSKNELHEFSLCNVPANPLALSEGKKSTGSAPNGERALPDPYFGFKMFIGGKA